MAFDLSYEAIAEVKLPMNMAKSIAPSTTVRHAKSCSVPMDGASHGDFITMLRARVHMA